MLSGIQCFYFIRKMKFYISVGNKWKVEKFSTFEDRRWSKPMSGNFFLRLNQNQVFICSKNAIYETIPLKHHTTHGTIRENTIIFFYEVEKKMRGIKILFSCDKNEIKTLIDAVSNFCIVKEFNKLQDIDGKTVALTSFQDMFKNEMERRNDYVTDCTLFPDDFPFEDFLKICIVDPNFPKIVDQVEKSLQQYLH